MKFILPFLFCCFLSFGQTLTEKWNQYQNRYEYFNSSNQLVGYKTYNSYTQSWEYYEQKPQQQVQYRDENFELWANVALAKQQKYDYNKQRINNTVKYIYERISNANCTRDELIELTEKFNANYIDAINKGKYDISYDAKADEIIRWLNNGASLLISECENKN